MDPTAMHPVARRVVRLEALGFALVIAVIWLDEGLDLPHRLLGAQATPFNWQESLIESVVIAVLAAAVCRHTARLMTRMRRLEGILPICASCKKVRDQQGAWHAVEVYVRERTEAEFSHGICPDCARRIYPEYEPEGQPGRAPR